MPDMGKISKLNPVNVVKNNSDNVIDLIKKDHVKVKELLQETKILPKQKNVGVDLNELGVTFLSEKERLEKPVQEMRRAS